MRKVIKSWFVFLIMMPIAGMSMEKENCDEPKESSQSAHALPNKNLDARNIDGIQEVSPPNDADMDDIFDEMSLRKRIAMKIQLMRQDKIRAFTR